ncbi:hypothetical protein CL629_01415 [bacterium]|nr:hypothetical protein [bacterium]
MTAAAAAIHKSGNHETSGRDATFIAGLVSLITAFICLSGAMVGAQENAMISNWIGAALLFAIGTILFNLDVWIFAQIDDDAGRPWSKRTAQAMNCLAIFCAIVTFLGTAAILLHI